MGSQCTKLFDVPHDSEIVELQTCLAELLLQLSPEELLIFVLEDKEIYEICKNNQALRQSCIVAAVRKYHTEKFFYEEVHNRTANFMVILDELVQIQDDYEMQELQKKTLFHWFPWCFQQKRRRFETSLRFVKNVPGTEDDSENGQVQIVEITENGDGNENGDYPQNGNE